MKRMSKLLLTLVIAVLMSTAVFASPLDSVERIEIGGVEFVPVRLAAYAYEATGVEWDAENLAVIVSYAFGDSIFSQTVRIEEHGGFIRDGISWIPVDFAEIFFADFEEGKARIEQQEREQAETDEEQAALNALIDAIADVADSVAERSEIMDITSTDGYTFQGRLTMPQGNEDVPAVVIFINGSGPSTFYHGRYTPGLGEWNFLDSHANEFANNGIAFFSYNARGVTPSTEPLSELMPFLVEIDMDGYMTYLPSNSVEDIYHMINAVQENPRLANAQIFLLGHSEGAHIAPLFAEKYPDMADALFLTGIPVTNMYEVVHFQASGEGVMMLFRSMFEYDEQGRITEETFYAGPWEVAFSGAGFDDLDINRDGFFDNQDLLILWEMSGVMPVHQFNAQPLLDAIERGDDEWIFENYPLPLTSGWFAEHFALRSNMEIIPELDLPIYIFHGTLDLNTSVLGVERLQELLEELGRNNVTINIFENHNHDLDWDFDAFAGVFSEGLQAVFDAITFRLQQ
ncbi:MAG: lysophospholipase [Defluviitaleaceae bacterium]|nr:lysophospholipase [Defluviitaleaceae bacterium]